MEEDADLAENNEQNYEPVITSSNAVERKQARRIRIQRRIEALNKLRDLEALGDTLQQTSEDEKPPIDMQIEKSLDILEKLKLEADEYVTNVRVANEAREADRREREGFGKEKLLQELEDEAATAEQMFNDIAAKWSGILKYNDPLHIHEDIESQKDKCDELIKQKDALIATLKAKLRTEEINFARDQRKQNQDINSLAQRIEKQVIAMRNSYRTELKMVEEVIMAERQLMIEANSKKWEDLAKKRDNEENANAEKKREDYWNFIKQMDDLNNDFEEMYRATKIKLETDYDDLQKEFERIKTEVLMNGEKLDYNYQILKKREDENMIIRSQQKRRINKLQDTINSMRKKIENYHKMTSTQIDKLTDEVKKLSRSVLDLDNKTDRVSKCNDQKFFKIWDMNWERAVALLDRILDIDRILHEQQLGIPWTKPNIHLVRRELLPSYKDAVFRLEKYKEDTNRTIKYELIDFEREKTQNYNNIMKNILHLIEDKTGFLVEEQLKSILKPYMSAEQSQIRIDNIFEALNVKDQMDMDLLLHHFLPYAFCPICSAQVESTNKVEEEPEPVLEGEMSQISHISRHNTSMADKISFAVDHVNISPLVVLGLDPGTQVNLGPMTVTIFENQLEGECQGPPREDVSKDANPEENVMEQATAKSKEPCQYHHPLVINPVFVLTALNDFLRQYHVIKKSKQKIDLSEKKLTISRLIAANDIAAYWNKISNAFPPEKEHLWECLLSGLRKYQDVLKNRKACLEQVQSLRRQTLELQRLFENYVDKHDLPY